MWEETPEGSFLVLVELDANQPKFFVFFLFKFVDRNTVEVTELQTEPAAGCWVRVESVIILVPKCF